MCVEILYMSITCGGGYIHCLDVHCMSVVLHNCVLPVGRKTSWDFAPFSLGSEDNIQKPTQEVESILKQGYLEKRSRGKSNIPFLKVSCNVVGMDWRLLNYAHHQQGIKMESENGAVVILGFFLRVVFLLVFYFGNSRVISLGRLWRWLEN